MQKNRGFSLIELLVVIVIMGILATIAIGSFQGFIHRAQVAKQRANVKSIYETILLTETQEWSKNKYNIADGKAIALILNQNGISIPDDEGSCYWYRFNLGDTDSSQDNGFVVVTWGADDQLIAQGTATEVDQAKNDNNLNQEKLKCGDDDEISGTYSYYQIPKDGQTSACQNIFSPSACKAAGCEPSSGILATCTSP